MMKLSRETWILLLTGAAAAAALALGVAAFRLARHEEEFRKEELRSLLKSECRLFAGRCRQALDAERRELAELAAGAVPSVAGIREAVGREPLFTAGFLARRDGTLLYPEPGSGWARRYGELFAGLVSARDAESTQFSNVVMPSDSALLYRTRTAPKRDDLRRIEPMAGTLGSSRMENRTDVLREAEAVPVPEAAAPVSKLKSKERSVRPAAPAKAAPAMEMAADVASPASADSPRMITRFAALTRKRRDGFIPWFTDNRFAPLIWAQSRNAPDLIAGFELEDTVLLSRLIPLFPEELPGYFRLELADAADRVVYATGGAFAANEEKRPEPVLVMPFSELLLPNMQLRAFLLPELLPTNSFRFGMGLALAALCLIIFAAGGVAFYLTRRELALAGQKSGFVSQVSHELKTPLTSIRMYSELLRDHLARLPQEKRERYLKVIADESERLTRLVGNVLDFGRLDEGRKRYHPAPVDLCELAGATGALWKELAAAENMTVEVRLPETAAECVVDRDSLMQVLYNLFSNALKYAGEGGKLDLTLAARADGRWTIAVRDYGPGIPAAAAEKIFRKFYRVDNSLTAEVSGFGLGLAIARQLMRDQGGDLLLVRKSPGAEFLIVLPKGNANGTV